MEEHDQQRIRLALEGALKRLKDGALQGAAGPDSSVLFADRLPVSQAPETEAPLVLVVLAGANSPRQIGMTPNAGGGDAIKQPLPHCPTHAGHERFVIGDTNSQTTAPKPCFIEPARDCVNSGACEMRGF